MSGRRRKGNRGISAVLGMIIVVAIIITALVPLILHERTTAMLQRQEIEWRTVLERERLDEDLELKAWEDWFEGTHEILLKIRNRCYLDITVVRIYVTPRNDPLKAPIEMQIAIPPNTAPLELSTGVVAQSGVTYDVKIVSERGNQYVPEGGSIEGGSARAFPNTLCVTILNMKKGLLYNFTVRAIYTGDDPAPEYFPISMEWKATAENQYQSLAFGITPGLYQVSIKDNKDWSESITVDTTLPTVSNPTVVFDCSEPKKTGPPTEG